VAEARRERENQKAPDPVTELVPSRMVSVRHMLHAKDHLADSTSIRCLKTPFNVPPQDLLQMSLWIVGVLTTTFQLTLPHSAIRNQLQILATLSDMTAQIKHSDSRRIAQPPIALPSKFKLSPLGIRLHVYGYLGFSVASVAWLSS
jgi:hypothetical protein